MKFRPLCFDYHTEASNLLRQERKQISRIEISLKYIDGEETDYEENETVASAFNSIQSKTLGKKRKNFSPAIETEKISVLYEVETTSNGDITSDREGSPNKRSRRHATNIVQVPSPRGTTLYDYPWLVALLSNIRRQCNQKRLADEPCFGLYCVKFCRDWHSWEKTAWLRMIDLANFCFLCRKTGLSAAAAVEDIETRSRLPELAVPKDEPEIPMSKQPYRYCLLDILQDETGKFLKQPLGSSDDRAETLKRELKAIVPYQPILNLVKQIKDSYHCAILTAVCIMRYKKSQELKKSENHSPEKRKFDQEMEMQAKESKFRKIDHNYLKDQDPMPPAKCKQNSQESLPSSAPRLHQSPSPELIKLNDLEQNETKAKAKEMILLEKFGLNPRDLQKKNSYEKTLRTNAVLAAPPLRCDSPSSLDYKLKQRSVNVMKDSKGEKLTTAKHLKRPPPAPERHPSQINQSSKRFQQPSLQSVYPVQVATKEKARKKSKKERKEAKKLAKRLRKAKRKLEKDMKKKPSKQRVVESSIDKAPKNDEPAASSSKVSVPSGSKATVSHTVFPRRSLTKDESHRESLESLQLLCSEAFLETWGEAVAKLALGEWTSNLNSRKISFLDTSLVDKCGVDIEAPGRGGIIVSALSSWQGQGFSSLVKRIVDLLSVSRYNTIEVLLCADIDQDEFIMKNMVTLQNAVLQKKGSLGTIVSFHLIPPSFLAESIGTSLRMHKSHQYMKEVEACLSDDRIFERLHFLLSLVPTLSATTALYSLISSPFFQGIEDDKSRKWFQELLGRNNHERDRMRALGNSGLINPAAAVQLCFALGVKVLSQEK